MGLNIWFAEDIRNALLAANQASGTTAALIAEIGTDNPNSAELLAMSLRAYREGYKAALATVALAFGIAPREIFPGLVQEVLPLDEEPDIDTPYDGWP